MPGENPLGWGYLGEGHPVQGAGIGAPFIPSTTIVYPPAVVPGDTVVAPFIPSLTVVYAPGSVSNASYARISQLALESLEAPLGQIRVSQLAVEVAKLRPTTASVALTQAVTEVAFQKPVLTLTDLSQLVVEVLVPPAPFVHTRFWAQIL